jgi:ligand-binding sensor domain-containing protein
MNKNKWYAVCWWILAGIGSTYAQDIPMGAWRSHISYNNILSITGSANAVYAAAPNGVAVFNKSDESITVLNKLNGLSGAGITSVAFDGLRQQLLVAYADGSLDVITADETISITQLRDSPSISGSRKIYHITIAGQLAYLATDYGVAVIDLITRAVKETFRDLGSSGETLAIYASTMKGDSIFLASADGVLAGDTDDNLLDFNQWRRFNTAALNDDIQAITVFDDRVFAAISGSGVYEYENGSWTLRFLNGQTFYSLTAGSSSLYVAAANGMWRADADNNLTSITNDALVRPQVAWPDGTTTWFGDAYTGLVRLSGAAFTIHTPDGPSFDGGQKLYTDPATQVVYAVSGGYTSAFTAALKNYPPNTFANGQWQTLEDVLQSDLTDVVVQGGDVYLASYGYGLQVVRANGTIDTYDDQNSPLLNTAPGNNVRISALAAAPDGVWVANYGATLPFHFLKTDGTWESYSIPVTGARYITDMLVDFLGNLWLVINPDQGGGMLVFKRGTGDYVFLSEVRNSGGLPSRSVYSIAADRDGQIWIGTEQGVGYFANPADAFRSPANVIRPIVDGRFLLRDDKITSIAVDGGNRKWIGTTRGAWLVNDFGEEAILNFTSANSALLSDDVTDIAVNGKTGEVFFMTGRGVVSFRSDASNGKPLLSTIKIFPNPVSMKFQGYVGITGLATDATVKITDVSGKLVWQTVANGGTAQWDVRDYTGSRAATGMYLVWAIAADGSESIVGKIAVVN